MMRMSTNCKVTDIQVKKLKEDDGEVSFAIKATITRILSIDGYGDDDKDVMIEIQGCDAEGFERTIIFLEGTVPVGVTKTLTKRDTYFDGDFNEIVSWMPKFDA